jgi:signal transduction histidine kinase/HPt (histidine-containing phosphotransfer) domain-containing protein
MTYHRRVIFPIIQGLYELNYQRTLVSYFFAAAINTGLRESNRVGRLRSVKDSMDETAGVIDRIWASLPENLPAVLAGIEEDWDSLDRTYEGWRDQYMTIFDAYTDLLLEEKAPPILEDLYQSFDEDERRMSRYSRDFYYALTTGLNKVVTRAGEVIWADEENSHNLTWILILLVTAFIGTSILLGVMIVRFSTKMIARIRTMQEEAEAAAEAKGRFLATMSHEIRTPMNAIIGMSSLMRTDNFDKTQAAYFRSIQQMAQALLSIINDILDFSKIASGKMELVPVHYHLPALFEHIVSLSKFIAENKGLRFVSSLGADVPEVVYGDDVRVRQILTNLVSNAVKYTKEGSVEISLTRGPCPEKGKAASNNLPGDYLIFRVKDTGIGLPEKDRDRLFESFQQFDREKNRGIQGTGLGLAITRQLVTLMEGVIEVESVYGEGSAFTIYLPLVEGDPAKVRDEKPRDLPVQAREGLRVLVVDDVRENLAVALGFLEKHHIRGETAESGPEAIAQVEKAAEEGRPYQVIFMDHMMPGMDGLEAARRIRERAKGGEQIPIIAFSANAVEGARERFLEAGMNDFVPKPLEEGPLNAALRKWLPEEWILPGAAPSGEPAETPGGESAPGEVPAALGALRIEGAPGEALDTEEGLRHCGGKWETYRKVLRQFCSHVEEKTTRILQSLLAKDWGAYRVEVHGCKGLLNSIGLPGGAAQGKELEDAARGIMTAPAGEGGSAEEAAQGEALCLARTGAFCSLLWTLREALLGTGLLSEGEGEKRPVSPEEYAGALQSLKEACDRGRPREVNACIARLEGFSLDGERGRRFADIKRLCETLDYEEAGKLCGE